MKFHLFALALLVSACSVTGVAPSYRDTSVPLSVTTRGAPAGEFGKMAGPWFLRAGYSRDYDLAMVNFLPGYASGNAVELRRAACDLSGDCVTEDTVLRATALGQNRWQLNGIESRELWVIWVDDNFRTAAIGTPDGSYAWILNREARGGADRLRAAREILEFNGYDTSRLTER
ncbi:lipocalin family protein [Roseovarius aestuariivivens]|uniref:lipocalin family protein n=1 Tax=Roseovarius aestuariivivens TaxID=1888910 RepID=UPI0010804759|nr:lipocalin family protein [Roseovarius aestuariivivens]